MDIIFLIFLIPPILPVLKQLLNYFTRPLFYQHNRTLITKLLPIFTNYVQHIHISSCAGWRQVFRLSIPALRRVIDGYILFFKNFLAIAVKDHHVLYFGDAIAFDEETVVAVIAVWSKSAWNIQLPLATEKTILTSSVAVQPNMVSTVTL